MGRSDLVGKRELWVLRMQRFAFCRLTLAASCDQKQVSIAAFYQRRKKLLTKDASDARTSAMAYSLMTRPTPIVKGFVPVKLLQPTGIEVRLVNGVTLTHPAGDLEVLQQTLNFVSCLPANLGSAWEGE